MLTLKETCSTREAAERLNVSLSTVQAWVEAGALQAWKTPGGHRRVLNASVERLLREGLSKPRSRTPAPGARAPGDGLRVLLVEDEPMVRQVYAEFLRQVEVPVTARFCENGYEALLRIGHEVPDLIITDLSMPEMDGFQMIRALREFNVTARTPIIVISGLSDADIEEEGGLPDDVLLLHKPVDKLRFLALIQQAFAHCQGAKAEAGIPAGG